MTIKTNINTRPVKHGGIDGWKKKVHPADDNASIKKKFECVNTDGMGMGILDAVGRDADAD